MRSKSNTRIALVQLSAGSDTDANLKKALGRIEEAAALGARVICLPELFKSIYFCQKEDTSYFDLAEPIPGPSTKAIGKVAERLQVVVIASLFEYRAEGLYHNTAAVIGDKGELLGIYRKMHIPDDPLYYEKYYFAPGDTGFCSFETPFIRIGVLICWDQWYPEAARMTALTGASVIFYPTAIGWHPAEKEMFGHSQLDAWRTIQRAHAIANGVYVAAVNRVGLEKMEENSDGLEFWGSSFVCDPSGVVVTESSTNGEEILIAEINPVQIEEVRRNWPFMRDRRIDAYGGILKRYIDEAK